MKNFTIKAVIEIPKGSFYKYEIDKNSGALNLDRPLNQKIPYNYGFIPETLCGDGDPLDVFVISHHAIPPLTQVEVIIAGVLKCTDNGDSDDKIIATIVGEGVDVESSLPDIIQYLHTYKTGFTVEKFEDAPWAIQAYQLSRVWPNPAD